MDDFYGCGSLAGLAGVAGAPAEDDIAAMGQWAADGFMGFPSHDDWVAEG
jgi:hypothetical protein